jgi:hypothetical protein
MGAAKQRREKIRPTSEGPRCVTPIDDAGERLCGAPAHEERTVERVVMTLCAAHAAELDAEFVIVKLRGGDASDATDAVCVDCDPGSVTSYEWRALVRRDRVGALLCNCGADLVGEAVDWDGEEFGDGNGGTVRREASGAVVGDGLYEKALAALPRGG